MRHEVLGCIDTYTDRRIHRRTNPYAKFLLGRTNRFSRPCPDEWMSSMKPSRQGREVEIVKAISEKQDLGKASDKHL